MPRDYDLNAMAVSGLETGKGKGKISGMPEGSHESVPPDYKWFDYPVRKQSKIHGSPIGIDGEVRKAKSKERMAAIGRALR